MTLYIPTFADPLSLAREQADQEIAEAQAEYIEKKTRAAERGEQPYEILPASEIAWEKVENPDGTFRMVMRAAESMSWDMTPGWEDRRIAEVRKMRAEGKRLDPPVFAIHDDGTREAIYPYGMVDLRWFEQGEACVRCRNWQPEDRKFSGRLAHKENHEKLQKITGSSPPDGIPLSDLCGFCGSRLDLQKFKQDDAGEAA